MRTATVAVLTAFALLVAAGGAMAHELPMKDAQKVAKREFKQWMRTVKKDDKQTGDKTLGSKLRRCQPQSDHLAICAYSWRYKSAPFRYEGRLLFGGTKYRCWGDIYVKYTASKRRRIGVSNDFIDCE